MSLWLQGCDRCCIVRILYISYCAYCQAVIAVTVAVANSSVFHVLVHDHPRISYFIISTWDQKGSLGRWYCWWKKSCTTQHVWSLVNNGIFTISTGSPDFWTINSINFWTSKSSDRHLAMPLKVTWSFLHKNSPGHHGLCVTAKYVLPLEIG